ncbi:MAG: hypothetical protein RLZZ450_2188 [Pseudomonadota bacterium]
MTESETATSADSDARGTPLSCWLLVLGWAVLVALLLARHEMWRDEVRALSLAMGAHSLSELSHSLRNEGHPMLWHALLFAGYGLTGSKLVLPVVSALICAAAVVLFVHRSPFPLWFKALFVLGGLPLYEYSVMARNYGISMLLMFVFAHLYPLRRERTLALGVVLALLANTNVHSALLAGILMAVWMTDVLLRGRTPPLGQEARQLYLAGLVLSAGIAFALWSVWPTSELAASDTTRYTIVDVLSAAWETVCNPAGAFHKIAPGKTGVLAVLASLVLVGATLGLLSYAPGLVASWTALLLLSAVFKLVYKGSLRHQGLFVVFLISLYWMMLEAGRAPLRNVVLRWLARTGTFVGLPILCTVLLGTGLYYAFVDLTGECSANRALANVLAATPRYAHAVLIGEPDYYLESLPYYSDNPIYLAREDRYGRTVRFVRDIRRDLSLRDLLVSALQVQRTSSEPVLIALGHLDALDLAAPPDGRAHTIEYPFARTFRWSPDDLAAWRANTKLVTTFRDVHGDERYGLYELTAAISNASAQHSSTTVSTAGARSRAAPRREPSSEE